MVVCALHYQLQIHCRSLERKVLSGQIGISISVYLCFNVFTVPWTAKVD